MRKLDVKTSYIARHVFFSIGLQSNKHLIIMQLIPHLEGINQITDKRSI